MLLGKKKTKDDSMYSNTIPTSWNVTYAAAPFYYFDITTPRNLLFFQKRNKK